jgi:Fe2+ or Zn2+ uptake regulation protein
VATETTNVHDLASVRLRALDQRYTRGRRAIVEVLAGADAPLSIPQLLECDRSLPQSSAYRNLAELERAGVVHRIVTSDEFSRYELAEDLTEHHHHLICTTCGDVRDFTVSSGLEDELDRALDRIAGAHGFAPDHHRLDLVGTCSTCS